MRCVKASRADLQSGWKRGLREGSMRRVWLVFAVWAGVVCNVAGAKTIHTEQASEGTLLTRQLARMTFSPLHELRPGLLTAVVPSELGVHSYKERYAGSNGRAIGEQGAFTVRRRTARSVRASTFGPQMPEPVALLLFGPMLFGASGLCVYPASRARRDGIRDVAGSLARVYGN